MMKFQFLGLAAMGALLLPSAVSANKIIQIDGIPTAMSSDANLIVGHKSSFGEARYTSFFYNIGTNEFVYATDGEEYDGSHNEGGWFTAVNNNGFVAGTIRNENMRLPLGSGDDFFRSENGEKRVVKRNASDVELGQAINSAATWRNGLPVILGCGPHAIEEFESDEDGSVATGISGDGMTIFGNIVKAWMPIEPVMWTYNATTDNFDYNILPLPAGCQMAYILGNASTPSGFPVYGQASFTTADGGAMYGIIWLSANEAVQVKLGDHDASYHSARGVNAISPDGRFAAVSGFGSSYFLGIYDTESRQVTQVPLPSDYVKAEAMTIDNNGNMTLTLTDTNWSEAPFFYERGSQTLVPFSSYLADVAPDLGITSTTFSMCRVMGVSGDGKGLLVARGYTGSEQYSLITLDNPALLSAPAPSTLDIFFSSTNEVTLTFDGIASVPEGCTLKGYDVYIGNALTQSIDAETLGGSYSVSSPAELGRTYRGYVVTRFEVDGRDCRSANSKYVSTFVSANTKLEEFVNFDDCTLDQQGNFIWNNDGWSAALNYGNVGEFILWNITSEDFENRTPYIATYAISNDPWSSVYTSRFFDASNAGKVLMNLRYQLKLVNSFEQDLTTDFLDIEATVDGKTWTVVKSIRASELTHGDWYNTTVDLSEAFAGKVFRVRLNAHGLGKATLMWSADDINMTTALKGDVPADLRWSKLADGSVRISWKNSIDHYDVSRIANSNYLWDYNVGNEGKPMIVAIDLPKDEMDGFEGEYINCISTFMFDDPNLEQANSTSAEGILYEDGVEVARASFEWDFNDILQSTAWFEEPVQIKKGSTYRAAVRIHDYDAAQAPIYLMAAQNWIPGVTDLYSEDEGKTWFNATKVVVSESNPYGMCIWPIRAHISGEQVYEPELRPDGFLRWYNVYRDGQLISGNIYESHPYIIDQKPVDGARYTVEAYYADGTVSEMSEPLVLDLSGVREVKFTLGVKVLADRIVISGDCKGASLIDMSGRTVARTAGSEVSTAGLPTGVYVLRAITSEGEESYKVAL